MTADRNQMIIDRLRLKMIAAAEQGGHPGQIKLTSETIVKFERRPPQAGVWRGGC